MAFIRQPEIPVPPLSLVPSLAGELIARGVTAGTADELVEKFSTGRIWQKIDVYDWIVEQKDRRSEQNPAGYLVSSISDNYAVPKGIEPRDMREQKKRTAEVRKKKLDETQRKRAQAQRANEEADLANRKAKADHVEAYLTELYVTECAAFIERAISNTSPQIKQQIQQGSGLLADLARRMAIEIEVLRGVTVT